jgi:hypothetical protein
MVFVFLSFGAVALFSFIAVATWSGERRREREAYYRSETLKRIAEAQATGGGSALEFLREEEKMSLRRRREGQRLGGLITIAVGAAMMIFLHAMPEADAHGAYLVGLIPLFIGLALLCYSLFLSPVE